MENIWLGRYPTRNYGLFRLVNNKKMYRDTKTLFDDIQIDIDPRTWVKDPLGLEDPIDGDREGGILQRQGHHHGRAHLLAHRERGQAPLRHHPQARDEGRAIIYISHKMEEILEIADEVTIMRDGKVVGTYPSKELTTDLIIKRMVGRDLTNRFPPRENVPGEVVFKVEGFTSANPRSFKDVSFELRKGEILGLGGLVGAQRTELVESIFGMRLVQSGKIFINGKEVSIKNPIQAKAHKIALLTEERRTTGIFPVLSVADNTLIANIARYIGRLLLLDRKRGATDVQKSVDSLRVKTPSAATLIQNLSGGNQQKVIVARWLLTEPEILILDEPTRGIDVGAKYEIYTIIADLAKRGKSVIMISSEMPELLGMSDRIMVMCEGRATGIIDGKTATQERIMELATQFMS